VRASGEHGLEFGKGGWMVLSFLVWLINCLVLFFFLSFSVFPSSSRSCDSS
jgi:hypothetical protein